MRTINLVLTDDEKHAIRSGLTYRIWEMERYIAEWTVQGNAEMIDGCKKKLAAARSALVKLDSASGIDSAGQR